MVKHTFYLTAIVGLIVLFSSCEKVFSPKPKGYNRIDLPEHEYKVIEYQHPYYFEYSKHAKMVDDTFSLFEPHWVHILYPDFKAKIELTYKSVKDDEKEFNELVNDAIRLTNKHNIKAYSIEESIIQTPLGKTASVFELEGEVPSQFQFIITDTSEHFARGALYFPVATKNDSLAPVIEHIKLDVIHMLNTFRWRGKDSIPDA